MILTFGILFSGSAFAQKVDYSAWDKLLKKHVKPSGLVDYKGFQKDQKELDKFLQSLSKVNVDKLPKLDQLVFWINVYNAFTIDFVARNYPVKSIKDIREAGLFRSVLGDKQIWVTNFRYRINGRNQTLHGVENGILMKDFDEPRIHFAINCASYSCPRLLNEAFTPENVEARMEQLAKEFVNNSTHNKITENAVQLSNIFNWYTKDFTKNGTLIDYLNKYSKVKINQNAKVTFLEYNWDLNEVK